MDFSGPEPSDYRNVGSLNRQFLILARHSHAGAGFRQMIEPALRPLIAGLTDLQIGRLSNAPFLLFSLRERDEDYWSGMFAEDRNMDLFDGPERGTGSSQLAAAGIAFLWQLARRNPYAARLVSGATLNWCERLVGCTLLPVLLRIAARNDVLQPRCVNDADLWIKLLGPGLSSEQAVRRSAHLSALQAILTGEPATHYRQVRSAACNTAVPVLRIAERRERRR